MRRAIEDYDHLVLLNRMWRKYLGPGGGFIGPSAGAAAWSEADRLLGRGQDAVSKLIWRMPSEGFARDQPYIVDAIAFDALRGQISDAVEAMTIAGL